MFAGPSNAGGAGARFVALPSGLGAGGGGADGLALASRMVVEDVGAGGRGEDETGAGAAAGRGGLLTFFGAAFACCSTSGSNCLSRSR